jgi:exopolyphosphatase/guanosine-5'-triphosphate,3'-diphosphate pyrophosphatase
MTRLAAIDCGTNTVLLTIAEVGVDGTVTAVLERAEITRLGEGLARSGIISDAAAERTRAVFADYVKLVEAQGCTRVLAVGTEALRRAHNGAAIVARIDQELGRVGGALEIIAGEREAQLAFHAVQGSFPELTGPRTVVDIGGGSTELVVGDRDVEQAVSIPIGSVVLTERWLLSDPPTAIERDALAAAIDEALAAAPPLAGPVVGIAGTVTTYAAMVLGLHDYDPTRVHGMTLEREALEREVARLGTMSIVDRRRTPGLQPKRADVIYAGGVILCRILEKAGVRECRVSDRGVRWALLYEAARC